MPRMTKAQAKRRLNEAKAKVKNVYVNYAMVLGPIAVTTSDMAAIEKIIDKCLKRLG